MTTPEKNGSEAPGAEMRAEEATLTQILLAKMQRQACLNEADQESVAYRISEIMVAAKELYTKDLPRLMHDSEEAPEGEMFQELTGLRMALFNVRDLITDFDEAFLDAMTHQREDDADESDDDEEEDESEDDEDEDEDEGDKPESE